MCVSLSLVLALAHICGGKCASKGVSPSGWKTGAGRMTEAGNQSHFHTTGAEGAIGRVCGSRSRCRTGKLLFSIAFSSTGGLLFAQQMGCWRCICVCVCVRQLGTQSMPVSMSVFATLNAFLHRVVCTYVCTHTPGAHEWVHCHRTMQLGAFLRPSAAVKARRVCGEDTRE